MAPSDAAEPAAADAARGPGGFEQLGGRLDPSHRPNARSVQAASSPSPEAIALADQYVLDELGHTFELIRSYAVSAREAASRGDRDEVRLRLRLQLRDAFRYAVELHKLLSPAPAEGGRK